MPSWISELKELGGVVVISGLVIWLLFKYLTMLTKEMIPVLTEIAKSLGELTKLIETVVVPLVQGGRRDV